MPAGTQPAARDRDDRLPALAAPHLARLVGQPPGQRLAVAVELVPGDGEGLGWAGGLAHLMSFVIVVNEVPHLRLGGVEEGGVAGAQRDQHGGALAVVARVAADEHARVAPVDLAQRAGDVALLEHGLDLARLRRRRLWRKRRPDGVQHGAHDGGHAGHDDHVADPESPAPC